MVWLVTSKIVQPVVKKRTRQMFVINAQNVG